jgi:hypothetical protein
VIGNRTDLFEKKLVFCFKRKMDKETCGKNIKYVNYGAGNNRYSTTIFTPSVKYPLRDFFYRRNKN